MFPQALVQNKILSKTKDDFTLNWSSAAPILNANYFYIDKLVEESDQYHKLLRTWTPTNEITPTMRVHEYAAAPEVIWNDQQPPQVVAYVGDWVGRVRNTGSDNLLDDLLILRASIQYYIYDDVTQSFVLNSTPGVPCIIRPSLWGMSSIKQVPLNDAQMRQNGAHFQYLCHSNDIKFRGRSSTAPITLAYTTDAVMGRILFNNQLIAHVPVTIQRKWNEQLVDYEFALTFPNFNFPPDAIVEFW